MAEAKSTVVIRRVKKVVAGGHHGGAWKVAYADFVTAMMAFFLVLWLVAATPKEERAALSEYFRNPSGLEGQSVSPGQAMNGPGGASTSMIKLGGTLDMTRESKGDPFGRDTRQAAADSEEQRKEKEKRRLEALMQELKEAMDKSQALEPFKDQLLLDITPEGLRIQIVDKQNRPMFDMGSARLKDYTIAILHELTTFINEVPNRISITGHTDVTAYNNRNGYSNWELSADRANAARRELVNGGMDEAKVTRVVGLSSSVLFDKQNPEDPINRRISIVVMTKDAEEAALADAGQKVALSEKLDDADTKVPDLSAGAQPANPDAAELAHPEAAATEAHAGASAAPAKVVPIQPPTAPGARPSVSIEAIEAATHAATDEHKH